MNKIRFIRKKEEWAHPASRDPKDQKQWTPKYHWSTEIEGIDRKTTTGTAVPMCKKCGVAPVRSRTPKRKGKTQTIVRKAGRDEVPRITVINTTRIYAKNGLCECCNIKKNHKGGKNSYGVASNVTKEGWLTFSGKNKK